jgi:hypothetical protein
MADQDEHEVLAQARNLPFVDRVSHKSWKVRSEAYESIASACNNALDETDSCFDEYGKSYILFLFA